MRVSLSIVLLLFCLKSFAINHQDEIAKAQNWVDQANTEYPILIFDRDKMNYLFATNNALGKSKEAAEARLEVIKTHIEQSTSLTLTKNELDNIDTYLTRLPSTAVALPITDNNFSYTTPPKFKFCAVFPFPPNSNAQIESERLAGLNQHESIPGHYHQLTKKMNYEELYLVSLYHEIGHCLDNTFLPKAFNSQDDPHGIHLSEAFAEVFSYLALSERLGQKMAEARALYRILYSRNMGQYMANDLSGAFGDQNYLSGGSIYHLGPYLIKAYQKLRFKKIAPDHNNPDQLVELAKNHIDDEQMDYKSFAAIAMALRDGFEVVIEEYAEESYDSPEFFFNTYTKLVEYKALTDTWTKKAFDSNLTPSTSSAIAPTVPLDQLCDAVASNNQEQYLSTLNGLRSHLQTGDYTPESSRERYEELSELNQLLNTECSSLKLNQLPNKQS